RDRTDGVGPDLVTALHELDELVDHGASLGDALFVPLEREPVAAQRDRAAEPLSQRVEHPVLDARELRGDVVRHCQHFLHVAQCRGGYGKGMRGRERKWWTLIVVCTAVFMLLLDITVVNVALPSIQRDLHASFSQLQWVVDAYALALATLVLTAGSLSDLIGR